MNLKDFPNKYFEHNQSHKIYKCTSVKAADDIWETDVNLERLGDKKAFSFLLGAFVQSYSLVDEEDLKLIEQHKERIKNSTKPITLEWLRNPPKEEEEATLGTVVTPDERDDFTNIVISEDVEKSINIGLKKIELKDFLNNEWNLKSIEPMDGRTALNFWGAPGTGKTFSVRAIARKLNRKLYIVNYSQIISKWVGDTAKNISQIFAEAKKLDCILFFDEADSLLSKRASMSEGVESYATSINQNRNVLMQEMDKFNGIMVFATNFFGNYDEAMLRRIAQHVEFKLPDEHMREQIFDKHIPKAVTRDESVSYKICAEKTDGLSGGDIKNVCLNAMVAAAMEEHKVLKQCFLDDEIKKIRSSKRKHNAKGFDKKPMGINATLREME
jgi:SpoVK/Ycf46/Vps4 family AAA+-type ATPase